MTRPREAQLPLLLTMSEGLSRGPDEMVPISRTDSMHAPSCGLAIRDAVEEIKWLRAEIERLRADNERLRDVLQRVSVRPSGDSTVQIAFVSEGCTVTYPVRPQTTWALEVMIEFDKVRRNALEGKP